MGVPAFKSERFVFTVENPETRRRKLFQILFRKSDGTLFVAFPYYAHETGLLTLATLRANAAYPTSLSLLDGGQVTGYKVKFTHHVDGNVHFSQDGKIRTKVRKRSTRLDSTDGHLFTIQLQGLKDFAEVKGNERLSLLTSKKTILNLKSETHTPMALKFVAHWYSKSALLSRVDRFGSNPWLTAERPDGTTVTAVILEDTFLQTKHPSYLLLTFEPVPMIDNSRYSSLTFVGGFDPPEVALNHNMDTSFLALAYPATESYDSLKRRIGCVDLRAPEVI